MQHNEVEEALSATMNQDGYELDGRDRLLIRKIVADGLAPEGRT